MDRDITEAEFLCEKAKNVQKFVNFIKGRTNDDKQDLIKEYYSRAALLYKKNKLYSNAYDIYTILLDIIKTDDPDWMQFAYYACACCKNMSNPNEYRNIHNRMIQVYQDNGRYYSACGLLVEDASMYKEYLECPSNPDELHHIIQLYDQALELINLDCNDHSSILDSCYLGKSRVYMLLEEYNEAATLLEYMASLYKDDSSRKYRITEWLFMSGLCRLISCNGEWHTFEHVLSNYSETIVTFDNMYIQCKMLHDLLDACKKDDEQKFSKLCFDYDKVKPFTPIETHLLLIVKRKLNNIQSDDLL